MTLKSSLLVRLAFSLLGREQYVPGQASDFYLKNVFLSRLQMDIYTNNFVRSDFILTIGLTESEIKALGYDTMDSLDELKASNLLKGPFRVALTNKPSEHLKFVGPHTQSTLRLLDIPVVFQLYHPQRTGIATYISLKMF
jgi:hypothetical protein